MRIMRLPLRRILVGTTYRSLRGSEARGGDQRVGNHFCRDPSAKAFDQAFRNAEPFLANTQTWLGNCPAQ